MNENSPKVCLSHYPPPSDFLNGIARIFVFCHSTTQTYICHELKLIEYVSHIE